MYMVTVIGLGNKKSPVKNAEAKEAIIKEAYKTWDEVAPILTEKYPTFEHRFSFSLNSRLKTTGGRILFTRGSRGNGRMELNTNLLAANLELVRMVYIHELAHLVQFHLRGYSNHGDEFKSIMESLGCEATTFMPKGLKPSLNKKPKKQYIYECREGCEHKLTIRKHNKILKFGNNYTCRRTKLTLKFKEIRMEEANNNFIGR